MVTHLLQSVRLFVFRAVFPSARIFSRNGSCLSGFVICAVSLEHIIASFCFKFPVFISISKSLSGRRVPGRDFLFLTN
jgi:hypothetical protein